MALTTVYLSSCSARRTELRQVAAELEVAGWQVVSSWLWIEAIDPDDTRAAAGAAERNIADLRRATTFVAFTGGPDGHRSGRGGRQAEFGMALGLGLRTIVVGEPEHVFHHSAQVTRLPDWPAAREALFAAG